MKQNLLYILLAVAFIILLESYLLLDSKYHQSGSTFNNESTVTVWKYQGHDMLLYYYKNSYSICHSPVCKKCYQMFD